MARAARDRGVDAAQTSTAAAMASRAPASSQPGRRAAPPRPHRTRPCPSQPGHAPALPAGLSRVFRGTAAPAAQHPAAVTPAAPRRADL